MTADKAQCYYIATVDPVKAPDKAHPKALLITAMMLAALFGCAQNTVILADTSALWMRAGKDQKTIDHILEMEWMIANDTLKFGHFLEVLPDPDKLDTIYYRRSADRDWDTLICNFKEPQLIKFVYNVCCDAFNVIDEHGKIVTGQVSFSVEMPRSSDMFLGILGEGGILINASTTNLLEPICRSVMLPNIYPLSLRKIGPCEDPLHCPEGICINSKQEEGSFIDFGYSAFATPIKCLFLPLDNEPLHVTYNAKTERVTIK
jgi:hypothetical protein